MLTVSWNDFKNYLLYLKLIKNKKILNIIKSRPATLKDIEIL